MWRDTLVKDDNVTLPMLNRKGLWRANLHVLAERTDQSVRKLELVYFCTAGKWIRVMMSLWTERSISRRARKHRYGCEIDLLHLFHTYTWMWNRPIKSISHRKLLHAVCYIKDILQGTTSLTRYEPIVEFNLFYCFKSLYISSILGQDICKIAAQELTSMW